MKPPYAIGSVPSLSGHAIAYRWRSLPRVRQHRASKPQGSFERVLPWQVTMDQLIFASLSHTHHWYEVGMVKVPAVERGSVASTQKPRGTAELSPGRGMPSSFKRVAKVSMTSSRGRRTPADLQVVHRTTPSAIGEKPPVMMIL